MNKENSTPVPPESAPVDTVAPLVDPQPTTPNSQLGTERRKGGGQPGNQNARTHGFYSRKAGAEQQEDAAESREVDGLDEEIELLRRKIRLIEETKPENVKLIAELIRTLSLVMSRRRYAGRGGFSAVTEMAKKMLENIIMPAGIIKDALDKMGVFKD